MRNNMVSISRIINAPVERVWQAWISPDEIGHWFIAEHGKTTKVIQMDVKVGGKARLMFPGAAGEYTWTYVQIEEPTKLVIDILDFSFAEYPKGNGGICNIDLEDLGDTTRVTVSGELPRDMQTEKMRRMAEKGWGFTLDNLNNFVGKEK